MKTTRLILLLLTGSLFLGFINYKDQAATKDYLNIPGPIKFRGITYNLTWSAHPTDNYYKQEYIPVNDTVEHFNKMILIDAIVSDTLSVVDAVRAEAAELDARKATDPVLHYQVFNNPDKTEYMVDFLESEGTVTALHIAEWNVYRYKAFKDKSGHKGVLLFASSARAYDDSIINFIKSIKTDRPEKLNDLIDYNIPEISISNN
jgi:hypothetical protein